jgi:hypothetical protein
MHPSTFLPSLNEADRLDRCDESLAHTVYYWIHTATDNSVGCLDLYILLLQSANINLNRDLYKNFFPRDDLAYYFVKIKNQAIEQTKTCLSTSCSYPTNTYNHVATTAGW